ncbi:hypothetical protein [Clostridium sp. JN-9]|uniref:hypothetical protein n=1 Tax=Clostridium sp. JN-9 TaxID=2507159 RepID=UPI0013E8E0FB|nr:hypothetical protein [Clostridium sp. JN-9]
MSNKGIKTMIIGVVIILIGIYIGILSLSGLKTHDNELFLIIIGAVVSIFGFFEK